MKRILLTVFTFLLIFHSYGQSNFPFNGIADRRANAYAFTNATIFVDYKTKLENATLLIKDGKVVQVSTDANIPDGYTTIDLQGRFIYPSFIDLHTNYGMPEVKKSGFSWQHSCVHDCTPTFEW